MRLLTDFLRLNPSEWSGVFTTGATASNVLGLACGREFIINRRLEACLGPEEQESLGSLGLLRACRITKTDEIHIFTTMAHSSLYKASSILGLGRSSVQDVRVSDCDFTFDIQDLEGRLVSGQYNSVSIVVVSCGEVNTGLFASYGDSDLQAIRSLCDKYGAWLHIDGGKSSLKFVDNRGVGVDILRSFWNIRQATQWSPWLRAHRTGRRRVRVGRLNRWRRAQAPQRAL